MNEMNEQIWWPGNTPDAIQPNIPWVVQEMLSNQAVLPSQYWPTSDVKSPECCLMLAVLWDAIRCYQGYDGGRRGRLAFEDARRWIESDESEGVFSFENICEVLGLMPQRVRQELLRWRGAATARRRVDAVPLRTIKRRGYI